MTNAELSPDIQGKFELALPLEGGPRQVFPTHGSIDLSKLSLADAQQLVANGFAWLKPVAAPVEKKKD